MIIHKNTGCAEIRPEFPNENFGEYENVFIVDDNSELGQKVKDMGGYVDFILDGEGNLVDVTAKERQPVSIQPKTEVELLRDELASTKSVVNFILMNF